jgi:F0F1-type ATP synthase delta subunit
MALSPRDYADALTRATHGQDEAAAAGITARFIAVLRRRGLAPLLPRIVAALPGVQRDGLMAVTVEAARRPDDTEVSSALRALGLERSSVKIEYRENPALLGGLRLRTVDRVLDLTASRRLADLGAAIGATRTR